MLDAFSIPAETGYSSRQAQRSPSFGAVVLGLSLPMRHGLEQALFAALGIESVPCESSQTSAQGVVHFVDIDCERSVACVRSRTIQTAIAVIPETYQDIEQLFGLGFADYIRPPFVPAVLKRRLSALDLATPHSPAKTLADRAKQYLEQDLSRSITLEDLARELGTNRTCLNAEFKSRQGVGPMTWLRNRRCLEAAQMLCDGTESVLNIALTVGYGDANNFSTAFRRIYGCSPLQFRKSCRTQRNDQHAQRQTRVQPASLNAWT